MAHEPDLATPERISELLAAWANRDPAAREELVPIVYGELRRLAHHYMRAERAGHTLQPTALVNEACLRLLGQRTKSWENRSHFVAVAAQVMRQVLVDFARRAKAEKRGFGVASEALDESMAADTAETPEMVLALDAALQRLAECDPRQARIVELRYFAGLSIEETAALLEVSPRTVKREWTVARAWLRGELGSANRHSSPTDTTAIG